MDQFVPADWTGNTGDAGFAPSRGEDDGLVELLWCGGHVVMHSQPSTPRAAAREHEATPWFQYPVVDDPLEKDLFSEVFGEMRAAAGGGRLAGSGTASDGAPLRGGETSEYMSGHDALSMRPKQPGATSLSSTAKRKQRDAAQSPSQVEGSDSAADAVTRCGPTPAKRRRAAQVHNLSERRRRDRINEKMRALQELVPHCNKTDRASMLDEAIEYLKSLQLQLQMMWTTGGGMAPAPAMFPASGAHRYMGSRMPPFRTQS